jgi:hypothetical protein
LSSSTSITRAPVPSFSSSTSITRAPVPS